MLRGGKFFLITSRKDTTMKNETKWSESPIHDKIRKWEEDQAANSRCSSSAGSPIGRQYKNRKTGYIWTVRAVYKCVEASDGSEGSEAYRLEKDAKCVRQRSAIIGKGSLKKEFVFFKENKPISKTAQHEET
jgi:hypothetical protein